MKKLIKIIGAAGAVALAAGLIPTHFKSDKESGEFEIGGLLWNLKKAPGEEEDTYTMQLLPFIDKEEDPVVTEVEVDVKENPASEETVEEPFAENTSDEVVVETAEEPAETPEVEAEPELKVEVVETAEKDAE